jgi:chitinase
LNNAWFDFVWVQFYNNYCSVQGSFNFDTWDNWATTQSKNPNVKVYLGVPGSTTAANSGYVPYTTLTSTIDSLKSYKSFGGVMMWDASQAYANTDASPNYATAVSGYIHNGQSSSSSGGASTSAVATSSATKASGSSTAKASTAKATSASATSASASASPSSGSGGDTGSSECPTAGGSCTSGYACAGSSVAICDNGKWSLTECPSSLVCTASADGSSAYCNYNTGAASSTCQASSNVKNLSSGSVKLETLPADSSSSSNTTGSIPNTKSANAQVSYFVDTSKNTQFQASFNVRNKASKPISNTWTLTFTAPDGQQIQKSSVGKVSQKGNQVTITANRKKVPSIMEAIVVDVSGSHNGTVFQAVDPSTIDFSW